MGVEQAFPPFFFKGNWPQVFFPFCCVEINLQLTFTYWCRSGLWRPQPEAFPAHKCVPEDSSHSEELTTQHHPTAELQGPGVGRAQLCQDPLLPGKEQAASCSCVTLVTKAAWLFKIIKRNCPPLTLVGQLLMKIKMTKSTFCQISCVQFTPRPAGHKTPGCPAHRELVSNFSCLQLDSHWIWWSNNRRGEFGVVTRLDGSWA